MTFLPIAAITGKEQGLRVEAAAISFFTIQESARPKFQQDLVPGEGSLLGRYTAVLALGPQVAGSTLGPLFHIKAPACGEFRDESHSYGLIESLSPPLRLHLQIGA